jgi:hypothetical protein
MQTNVTEILAERQGTHGDFHENAKCSQELKSIVYEYGTNNPDLFSSVQREALDNICQKMSRIITGNPNHIDSWVDIAGYATLAAKDIERGAS